MIKNISHTSHQSRTARNLNRSLAVLTASIAIHACGGSAGGSDAGDIARVESARVDASLVDAGQDGESSPVGNITQGGIEQGGPAQDGVEEQPLVQMTDNNAQLQDDVSCNAEIDIAEFFLTESDRQWTCEVSSSAGIRFDDLYFERNGTANFANSGVWYWNRNLPADEVNLASPGISSMLMTDIGSSNTLLMFRTISETEVEELYDCVLVSRGDDQINL